MRRRHLLAAACAHCTALGAAWLPGAAGAQTSDWAMPARFARPDAASDEGGLWDMMEREERRVRRSPFFMRDAGLRDYLREIACKLGGGHCADIRVYPIRTPFFNASMAPNGMMQVWSGLLLRVENEAQLAAVIGHEIAHYLQRHTLDQLRDAKSRSAFATFMSLTGLVGLVAQLALLAGGFAFSRDQEREADGIGLTLLRQAGYDPREAARVWDNLHQELQATGADPGRDSPMFATHPTTAERGETLRAMVGDATTGFIGETEYAARIAPFLSGLLDDELGRGQHAQSIALLDRLIRRSPRHAALYYYRAEARRRRAAGEEDIDKALVDLRDAIRLGSEPAQTHRSLGYIHRGRRQPADARAAFARYLELAPDAPDAGMIRTYLPES